MLRQCPALHLHPLCDSCSGWGHIEVHALYPMPNAPCARRSTAPTNTSARSKGALVRARRAPTPWLTVLAAKAHIRRSQTCTRRRQAAKGRESRLPPRHKEDSSVSTPPPSSPPEQVVTRGGEGGTNPAAAGWRSGGPAARTKVGGRVG